jgi:hypothetical protein
MIPITHPFRKVREKNGAPGDKFEGIVKSLLQSKPLKRENVKVSKRKPEKLIPPQK